MNQVLTKRRGNVSFVAEGPLEKFQIDLNLNNIYIYMSKTLWHTIQLEVPKEMVNITKKDKVVVKKSLTKTNNISKANKEPSIKIIPRDTNKPKIIDNGQEWNIEELKSKMKKAKELGKKNEGTVYKKPAVKKETVKKYVEDFNYRKRGYIQERIRSKERFDESIEKN